MKVTFLFLTLLLFVSPISSRQPRSKQEKKNKEHDYYELLRLKKPSDQKAIKSAYRAQALKYHPDKNPGDEKAASRFSLIAEAYGVLSDPKKKKVYDQYGKQGLDVHEKGGDPRYSGGGGGHSGGGGGGGGPPRGFPQAGADFQFNFNNMFKSEYAQHQQQRQQRQRQQQQRQQQKQQQRQKLFSAKEINNTPNFYVLSNSNFPASSSPHLYLVLFQSSSMPQSNKQAFLDVNDKIKSFCRIGVVDCDFVHNFQFCREKVGPGGGVATVMVDGVFEVLSVPQNTKLNVKMLQTFATRHFAPDDSVIIINQVNSIRTKLLVDLEKPMVEKFRDFYKKFGQNQDHSKKIAVLLLTDKFESSRMWASLTHQFKSKILLGDCRASNLKLAKKFKVKSYPHLVAVEDDPDDEFGFRIKEKFSGKIEREAVVRWIDSLVVKNEGSGKKQQKQKQQKQKQKTKRKGKKEL